MKTKLLLCCVAGKSGGHILPCLQFAKTHYSQKSDILFVSTPSSLDAAIVATFSIKDHYTLSVPTLPYRAWWKMPFFVWKTAYAVYKSLRYLHQHKPDRIVSTGGFIAVPFCLAAWLLRIPIDLIELNGIPGKATAFLHSFATTTFICFTTAAQYFKGNTTLIEYPLRFSKQDKTIQKKETLTRLGLPENITVLLLGGSQGSEFLNELMQEIPLTQIQRYTIIHQTGSQQVAQCNLFYKSHNIAAHVFSYEANLAPYYAAADIIICRAGAGTLFEALFFQKKCIVIPLETTTTDHQVNNAKLFQTSYPELFYMLRQHNCSVQPELFFKLLP